MELCSGFYRKAADWRADIQLDNDSLYTSKVLAYKEGLYFFALGMDAVKNNQIAEAKRWADALDASLWRNTNQRVGDDVISTRRLNDLNVASLELQGLIKSAEHKHTEAIGILKKAKKQEDDLGYSEPPSYARPVLISLGETYLKTNDYSNAIAAYEQLLERHPNSANAYWGLYKVYKQKGDPAKSKEYATRLSTVTQFGEKS